MKELQLISNHQAPEKPKSKGFFDRDICPLSGRWCICDCKLTCWDHYRSNPIKVSTIFNGTAIRPMTVKELIFEWINRLADRKFWLGFSLGILVMFCIDAQLWGLW